MTPSKCAASGPHCNLTLPVSAGSEEDGDVHPPSICSQASIPSHLGVLVMAKIRADAASPWASITLSGSIPRPRHFKITKNVFCKRQHNLIWTHSKPLEDLEESLLKLYYDDPPNNQFKKTKTNKNPIYPTLGARQ